MLTIQSISKVLSCLATAVVLTQGQEPPQGPFPPSDWPASADPNKVVHFVSVGNTLAPLGPNWITGNMNILSGGDQVTAPITIGGYEGLKAIGNYLNVADFDFTEWADDEEIDILVQVYGDGALFQANGSPRNFHFLIGTLPELAAPNGGQIPAEARNRKWNWVLFRIPNSIRPSDGTRRVGSIPANAQGAVQAGGVNGGTIRMEAVPNLIVRAVAFGERGAFGEPEQVNRFAPAEECPTEPATNLAWIDLKNNQSFHLQVMNDKDQTVTIQENVGPADDKRRAVLPLGSYMNFAVTEDYLGAACNDARTVKICLEYYDDPALAGVQFGPEAFATDNQGAIAFVPAEKRQVLKGTGRWERRSWIVPAVSLFGVNTAPLTAGPRLYFDGPVAISHYSFGIYRIGTNALAGVDPIPDCFEDPEFCKGTYGNYAEMDLQTGVLDGLAPGTSGGDQEMIIAEAGPANDRRQAIRPARNDGSSQFAHNFLNFAITDEKLGPSSQPGVHLAICVTYYDDPALIGATFRPEVYISDRGGNVGFAFTSPATAVRLEGSDQWKEAYFELTDVKFNGVNQGPQAAARFVVSDKVFFSRVRYGVIRPCGPEANVNPLEGCKPVFLKAERTSSGSVRISWPSVATGYHLVEAADLSGATWSTTQATPTVEGNENVVTVTPTGTRFYRLMKSN